jgi:hypothetical protein
MAFEGELVKLNNGRWARFQRCQVSGGDGYQSSMLVAVELDGRYQQMLDEAHGELLGSKRAPSRLSLDADGSLQVTEAAAY